jgi:hypothetical protein
VSKACSIGAPSVARDERRVIGKEKGNGKVSEQRIVPANHWKEAEAAWSNPRTQPEKNA